MGKFISDTDMEKMEGSGKPRFISDDDMAAHEENNQTSALESGLRGLAQGASLGFADEITGGLESLRGDKTYEQARDESRANYHKAEDDNPLTYGAGQLGGGAATMLVPGAGVAKLAGLGAAAGLGNSEADNIGDQAVDTLKGAGIGLAASAIPGIGSMGKNVIDEVATTPLAGPAQGMVGKAMQGVQTIGTKGNELLDKVAGGPLGRVLRYGVAPKVQVPLGIAENGPKAAQYLAGKASGGLGYLQNSPAFSKMSEGAFNSLSNKMASTFSAKQPVSHKQAKQDFIEGN